MRIALLGATSATGTLLIAAALREGHEVRALIRAARPGSRVRNLPLRDGLFQLSGDATDERCVRELLSGAEVAVSLVGPVQDSAPDLCARSTHAIVGAAREHGVSRLVLVSGAMINHPAAHSHGLYRVAPALLGTMRRDRLAAEQTVMDGPIPFCIVRPPRLGDGPSEHWATVGPEIEIGTMDSIPRIDLAEVLLEASLGRWDGLGVAARTAHVDERAAALRVPISSRRSTAPLPARPRLRAK